MGCFGNKGEREVLLKNKRIIEDNANQINVLKEMAASEPELVAMLDELQDLLRYFNPTVNESAHKYDKKIADNIGDAKIILSKAEKKEDYKKAYDIVKEIKYLAVERKNVRQD